MLSFTTQTPGWEVMDQLTDDPEEMAQALGAMQSRGMDEFWREVADCLTDDQADAIVANLRAAADAIEVAMAGDS